MSEWREMTLGLICDEGGGGIQTGPFGSQLHASDYVSDGVPSVMPQNIGDNLINEEGIARISQSDAKRLDRYLLRDRDIVYSRRGDVEKRSIVRAHQAGWLCGTGCLRVRVGDQDRFDSRFLSYALGTPDSREWITQHAVGATMPNLNTSILRGVPLRVPGIPLQRAIAEVLDALDDKIAANTKLASISRELAIALMAKVTEETKLQEVAELSRVVVDPAVLPDAAVAHFSLPAFDAGSSPVVELPSQIQSQKFLIEQPSVLLSKLNPRFPRVWNVGVLPAQASVASTEFLVLRPVSSSTELLWAALSQPSFGLRLDAKVTGTSGSHQRVKPTDALSTPVKDIRVISVTSSTAITAAVKAADSMVLENRTLATLRDTLLPQLMSGKLRVRDAERAVSEVL